MNITTTKKVLEGAIYAAQRVAPTTAPLPLLSGVLLSATGKNLTVTGTNLNTTVVCTITPEEIIDEGEVVLPAKHLYELVKRLPDGPVNLTQEKDCVKIFYEKQQASVRFYASDDFPVVPKEKDIETIEVNIEALRSATQKVAFACSDDQVQGNLTGVHFSVTPFGVELVATNRHRISYVNVSDIAVGNDFKITIPKSTIEQLKLFPDKTIKIAFDESMVVFEGENLLIVSSLLAGRFFDHNSLPRDFTSECTIKTKELLATLNRVALISKKVCLSSKMDSLIITAEGEKGWVCESIEIRHAGKPINIVLSAEYLIDALSVSGNKVTLKFLDARACQVECGNFYCFIMAMVSPGQKSA